jgi:hypothetical protein
VFEDGSCACARVAQAHTAITINIPDLNLPITRSSIRRCFLEVGCIRFDCVGFILTTHQSPSF